MRIPTNARSETFPSVSHLKRVIIATHHTPALTNTGLPHSASAALLHIVAANLSQQKGYSLSSCFKTCGNDRHFSGTFFISLSKNCWLLLSKSALSHSTPRISQMQASTTSQLPSIALRLIPTTRMACAAPRIQKELQQRCAKYLLALL